MAENHDSAPATTAPCEAERRAVATRALLELFARKTSRREYLDAVVQIIREWCGCRCIGIRVIDRRGHVPYASYIGFSREFWKLENKLNLRTDQCICTRAIRREAEAQEQPLATPYGTLCVNDASHFIGGLTPEQQTRYRGTCIREGFATIAAVPIRHGEQTVGAIHLADERQGMASPACIQFLESIGPLIGEAVYRFDAEEALREQAALLDLTRDAIVVRGLDDRITFWTAGASKTYGFSLQEAAGKVCHELLHTEFPMPLEQLQEALSQEGQWEGELVQVRRDGQRIIVSSHWAMQRDREGLPLAILETNRDITRRKLAEEELNSYRRQLEQMVEDRTSRLLKANEQLHRDVAERVRAEESLRRSEERYRTLFTAMSEGFALHEIICDDEGKPYDYRILEVNPAFERLTGLRQSESIGRTIRQLLPDTEHHWIETYGRVALLGEPSHFQNHSKALGKCFEVFAFSPSKGLFATLFIDVTERKRAEQAIERQRRLIDAIFNNILAHVAYLDREFNFVRVNATYAKGSGHSIDELIGRNHFDLFPNEENRLLFEHVRDTGEHYVARAKPFVYADQPEKGVTYWDWWLYPIVSADGSTEGLVLSLVDVTPIECARQEVERLNRELHNANAAKDQFLAALSHELRTPLTPVLMTASAMEVDQTLPRHVHDDIATIRRNVELETRLIDDLLDLTRISHGKLKLELGAVDVHRKLRNVLDILDGDIRAKQMAILLELNAACYWVRADRARLQQVFWNIVKNAVKFTPQEGRITIRTWNGEEGERSDERGGRDAEDGGTQNSECRGDAGPRDGAFRSGARLFIEISDTGIGIDSQMLPRIFDAFEQGGAATTRRFGGLGLGLAISKALIESHGGRIVAMSEGRNRGTTFRIELAAIAHELVLPAAPADRRASISRLRILLVEDHESTASVLARLLRACDHSVMVGDSVQAALKLAASNEFDLVISDLGLPDGSGLDLMRQLKSRHRIRAIALSGYGTEQDVQRSYEAGFDAHLTKPIALQQLERAIGEVMNQ